MTLPSDDRVAPSRFDRFADKINAFTARSWFFAGCMALVVLWVPSYWLIKDVNTWQLLLNTPTTAITFLLVALAANSNARSQRATHTRDNAIAQGVADLLDETDRGDAAELRESIGIEDRQSSSEA